ncbi:hypothetical protein ACIP2X_19015 [Streptomyces sp. NPDC089424]|uniref:hypothetical protein n=1 Tax=Streptomyces sp. NPDC089424 TaxID=3365917 RepID=UPI00381D47E8
MPRRVRDRLENVTWTTTVFAGVFWLLCLGGIACNLAGNQAAFNGVLGAGFAALVFTAAAWGMHRQDQRLAARNPEAYPPRRPRQR